MSKPTNSDRSSHAAAALATYSNEARPEPRPDGSVPSQAVLLRDLLVALMHHADASALAFDPLVESATRIYRRQALYELPDRREGSDPFFVTDQETIGLLVEDTADAARDLAACVTRDEAGAGVNSLQATDRLLEGLGRVVRSLARTFPQISDYLDREARAGRLVDVHDDPLQAVQLATLYLQVAAGTATSMTGSLNRSRQAIKGMRAAASESPAALAGHDFPNPSPDVTAPPRPRQENPQPNTQTRPNTPRM